MPLNPSLRSRAGLPTPPRPCARLLVALAASRSLRRCLRADTIPVESAELRVEEGEVLLSAEFDFALTPALEEALEKGIPLYFTIEFELVAHALLWFPEKVAEWSITYRVSYSALTRQYRVSSGPLGQTFESLDEVERFIGRVASRPVARARRADEGRALRGGRAPAARRQPAAEAVPGERARVARMAAAPPTGIGSSFTP